MEDMIGEYFLRTALASACGLAIGIERDSRLKQAGVRTHMIVALGAALMTIVSKYGFFDLASYDFIHVDPSRVVANVVCGVGFLGAGTIFSHHRTVTGLTTAAGLWATAGIGMAVGAGMYAVGAFSTALVLAIQLVLHADNGVRSLRKIPGRLELTLMAKESPEIVGLIVDCIRESGAQVINMEVTHERNNRVKMEMLLRIASGSDGPQMAEKLEKVQDVISLAF